jgi:hypothetical protein
MKNHKGQCETCAALSTILFLSYVEGMGWQCARCALQLDPFMSKEQTRRVQEYLRKSEQALKNFTKEAA